MRLGWDACREKKSVRLRARCQYCRAWRSALMCLLAVTIQHLTSGCIRHLLPVPAANFGGRRRAHGGGGRDARGRGRAGVRGGAGAPRGGRARVRGDRAQRRLVALAQRFHAQHRRRARGQRRAAHRRAQPGGPGRQARAGVGCSLGVWCAQKAAMHTVPRCGRALLPGLRMRSGSRHRDTQGA